MLIAVDPKILPSLFSLFFSFFSFFYLYLYIYFSFFIPPLIFALFFFTHFSMWLPHFFSLFFPFLFFFLLSTTHHTLLPEAHGTPHSSLLLALHFSFFSFFSFIPIFSLTQKPIIPIHAGSITNQSPPVAATSPTAPLSFPHFLSPHLFPFCFIFFIYFFLSFLSFPLTSTVSPCHPPFLQEMVSGNFLFSYLFIYFIFTVFWYYFI